MTTTALEPLISAAPAPTPVLSDADLRELLGAFNDATSRLHAAHQSLQGEVARLKDELRQANEALERSRRLAALGEMAAGIAHEIRNPLGSIRLYARMLDEDLRDRPAERGVAQRIGAAVKTVDAVVRDVLAFAREVRVRPEPAEVDDLFTRAIEEALGTGEHGGVEIRREDRGGRIRSAWCDAALVQRALVNIVSNALQAMSEAPQGGAATGGARVLTTAAAARTIVDADGSRRRFIALSVADTGPGIPPQVMERMFNPFFTTRATGTGLGLAIVHRIVDAHGGRIVVRNRADGDAARGGGGEGGRGGEARSGAVVELLLPAAAGSAHTPAAGNEAAPSAHRRKRSVPRRPGTRGARHEDARTSEDAG